LAQGPFVDGRHELYLAVDDNYRDKDVVSPEQRRIATNVNLLHRQAVPTLQSTQ